MVLLGQYGTGSEVFSGTQTKISSFGLASISALSNVCECESRGEFYETLEVIFANNVVKSADFD